MFYYLRLVVAMYLRDGKEADVATSGSLRLVAAICLIVTILFGVLPNVLGAAEKVVDVPELQAGLGEIARFQVPGEFMLVRPEHERRVELGARAKGVGAQHRQRTAVHRLVGCSGVGTLDVCPGSGQAPIRRRIPGEAGRVRIERAARIIEVGAGLVGLTTVEDRRFESQRSREHARGEDAEGDVRSVLPVVHDRRERIVHRRRAMRERDRPHRRLADGRRVQRDADAIGDRALEESGELHDEIVRVLSVVQRLALVRLSGLEEQGITLTAQRPRLGAAHRAELELARRGLPRRHEHRPVQARHVVDAARAVLLIVHPEYDAVRHERPFAGTRVDGTHRRGIWKPRCPRAGALHWNPERCGDLHRPLGRRIHFRLVIHVRHVVLLRTSTGGGNRDREGSRRHAERRAPTPAQLSRHDTEKHQ